MTTEDYIAERLSFFENCMEVGDYEHAQKHLELASKRLALDADFPAVEKALLLAGLKEQEDRSFAFGFEALMADGRPASEQRELARTLCRAGADEISAFRLRVESGASLRNSDSVTALIGG